MKQTVFVIACAALIFNAAAAFSKSPAALGDASLHITADTMVSDQTESYVEFSGNVVATRDDAVISADTIRIFIYSDDEKKAHPDQSIKTIEAKGNVEYVSGNRRALSDKAVYTTSDQKLVLTGSAPKVFTGESFVTGRTITLYRENNKVLVEGGGQQRVEALFNPKDAKDTTKN